MQSTNYGVSVICDPVLLEVVELYGQGLGVYHGERKVGTYLRGSVGSSGFGLGSEVS